MRITTMAIAVAVSLLSCLQPTSSPAANKQQTQSSLHRADFRVEGASCVACLRRIAKALRDAKGVLKADVSIYRPYWAIVIYDSKATAFDKLQAPILKQEKVRFSDIEDKTIAELPLIVIPKVSAPPVKAH